MRISSSVSGVGLCAVLALAAGSVVLSAEKQTGFTIHDKAYYADSNTVNFVRPGFVITIVSANVDKDGTISVDYKLSDPKGQPLDLSGVQTPGTVSVSFIAAYIPKGQTQFVSYATRPQTSPITKVTALQAGTDSGGTTQTVSLGEYIYTFKQKAVPPSGSYDATATHRIGVYGSRNLTEFDLGTSYDDATYDFVPAGGKVTATRDVIRTQSCNKCHDQLSAHGGSRRSVELCIMCHTPQTVDPDTGNSVDMKVFIHKLHMGSQLPSVQAGKPYQIIGHNQSVSDWSTVNLPSDPRRCEFCHESKTGAAQANAWFANPNRDACGSCHDDVNFASGKNHVNLPQVDDKQCSGCHIEKGELEFDASIRGAHTYPQESAANPGMVLKITKVENGGAGQKPTVTFTIKDSAGNGVTNTALTGGRLSLVLAGPTSDYGYTGFGSDVTTNGYVAENAITAAKCAGDGTCTYTFTHAIPANAKGSFSIGIEGRRTFTILKGTVLEQSVTYGANNDVFIFSVDGTPVQKRRTVVALANCNNCHSRLTIHGENRNQIEQCVLCHNPSMDDSPTRPAAQVASDKALPPQGVNFAMMIHKIHTGEKLASDFKQTYIIVGNGGSHNDFSEVRYPAMGPTGSTGDTAKCYMCHVNSSEAVFPIGKNNVADQQGLLNPAPATTSACTACHLQRSAFAHAVTQTDPKFGESCDTCHAAGASADVIQKHAGK
jgi:OmcA/MtrC family decaheme c-type cytochrome